MLRFLLRRIPRFGFLTLFAAMLLFVSVAGWAKWNLDLWQEEEALLADLAKAGVRYTCIRHSGDFSDGSGLGPAAPNGGIWSAFAPYVSRIRVIALLHPTPHPLLDRAAQLPYVEHVRGNWGIRGSVPLESTAALAGFDVAPLEAPEVPTSLEPLPRGSRMEGDEATQALQRFAEAWERPEAEPKVGSSYVVLSGMGGQFRCKDENRHFHLGDEYFVIGSRKSSGAFGFHAGGVLQENRSLGEAVRFEEEDSPLILFDAGGSLFLALAAYDLEAAFAEALRSPSVVRVERIDQKRVRFDLPPLIARYAAADCEDAYAISFVARSDLDWELEAWDATGVRTEGPATPANLPPTMNSGYRGTLHSEDGRIVAETATWDCVADSVSPTPGMPPSLAASRSSGVASYDFSPDLDLSHVTPESFGAKMLPPRRELPWLRWYRVTFGLSLALFGFVATRRLVGRKQRAEALPA